MATIKSIKFLLLINEIKKIIIIVYSISSFVQLLVSLLMIAWLDLFFWSGPYKRTNVFYLIVGISAITIGLFSLITLKNILNLGFKYTDLKQVTLIFFVFNVGLAISLGMAALQRLNSWLGFIVHFTFVALFAISLINFELQKKLK